MLPAAAFVFSRFELLFLADHAENNNARFNEAKRETENGIVAGGSLSAANLLRFFFCSSYS